MVGLQSNWSDIYVSCMHEYILYNARILGAAFILYEIEAIDVMADSSRVDVSTSNALLGASKQ